LDGPERIAARQKCSDPLLINNFESCFDSRGVCEGTEVRELSRLPASAQATLVVVLTALAAVTIPAAAESPTSFPCV
jgi:hypothetical protein